ncbi:MAG: hypothetical protein GX640_04485 [Fibrobacter sp.]|nr:hypothetical protein [Fibrobacter sp.]
MVLFALLYLAGMFAWVTGKSFMFHHTLSYFVTHFEEIIEVLVFLSLPAVGYLLRR